MRALIRLLRPRQWTKNGACLAGLVFGEGMLTDFSAVPPALLAVVAFSAVSSAVYVANDVADLERDRQHPRKRHRPLASGEVGKVTAGVLAGLLGLTGLALGLVLGPAVLACLVLYLLLNTAYSARLKHVAVMDVGCIALGFVLRLFAGVYAVGLVPTSWITLCTFFLALFLGLAKRRSELAALELAPSSEQRPVLSAYTLPTLDSFVNGAAIMTVTCYALFTASADKNPTLVLTVPIVYFAIMRYRLEVQGSRSGEEPESILLEDRVLQLSIAAWLLAYLVITRADVGWITR